MSTLKVNNITDLGDDAVVTSGVLDTLAVPAGGILQIVSTTKQDTFSASLSAGAISGDITGLTATLTPSSASNKVKLSCSLTLGTDSVTEPIYASFFRDGTQIADAAGTAEGSKSSAITAITAPNVFVQTSMSFEFLDSPATTSSVTYSVRLRNGKDGTAVVYVNRASSEIDSARVARTSSTITVMEVAG